MVCHIFKEQRGECKASRIEAEKRDRILSSPSGEVGRCAASGRRGRAPRATIFGADSSRTPLFPGGAGRISEPTGPCQVCSNLWAPDKIRGKPCSPCHPGRMPRAGGAQGRDPETSPSARSLRQIQASARLGPGLPPCFRRACIRDDSVRFFFPAGGSGPMRSIGSKGASVASDDLRSRSLPHPACFPEERGEFLEKSVCPCLSAIRLRPGKPGRPRLNAEE